MFVKKISNYILIPLASTLIVLFALEGAIRIYGKVRTAYSDPASSHTLFIPDARLGHRPNPAYEGHDSRGWRNSAALDRADMVVLGDSQTYGLNVPLQDAWPQVLGRMDEINVYQIAFGGYGPAHYAQLIDDALSLGPSAVTAAYYFGNDVLDSYWQVYNVKPESVKRTLDAPVLDSFISSDPRIMRALDQAESVDPRHRRHQYLDCQSPRFVPDPRLQAVEYSNVSISAEPSLFAIMLEKSILYQTVESKLSIIKSRWGLSVEKDYGPPLCIPLEVGSVHTTLTPGYRLLTLTSTDPRVLEGKRISLAAFDYIARRCRSAGVDFSVLIIPTKEYVFRQYADLNLEHSEYLASLLEEETVARNEAISYFRENNIDYVDSLGVLEDLVKKGVNPYKQSIGKPREDGDGHPVQAGYSAIALAVHQHRAMGSKD